MSHDDPEILAAVLRGAGAETEEQSGPDTFNLTAAAGMFLAFHDNPRLNVAVQMGARAVWSALVALPDAEALAFARTLTADGHVVLAHRSPF